ncbi:phosphomannomutase [Marinomonas foliarum]|uniref:Phosphomannomutase n=1 Tax=Marinomonas foliarum TaxID=491950 RepID=A0A368ZTP8_9GAMM|nr:phosphomannomutase [Marinomonas foliarum]RCX00361.1 phosphomannomutase [Marinomonas foliarum]
MSTNTVQVKQLSDELGVAFGTSGVRGLVKDLTPTLCFAFVRSFLQRVCPSASSVAIGMDLRPSSPEIAKACLLAVESFGVDVVFCGAVPTPALAFYAMQNNMPSVMITGSHIPFDRNGIKFYRSDGEISKPDEEAIMSGLVDLPDFLSEQAALLVLPVVDYSAIEYFKQRYTSLFPSNMLEDKRIGVYEHSSVARDVIKELLAHFGAEVVSLERTETFVPIDTEAVSEEDVQKGLNWSKEYKLDAIISTDGDGDRPLIANEKGEWLRGDILGVLCADYLQASHVVAPVNVNTVLELEGQKQPLARISLRTKIGSPYVIAGMDMLLNQSPDARLVGYEANGGFLVGSDFVVNNETLHALPTRDCVLPALIVLAMSFEQARPVSQLTNEFSKRFTASDRMKDIPTDVSRKLIADIKVSKDEQAELLAAIAQSGERLEVVAIDETDGLRMTLNTNDIVHLRPSGNAPELRCYVESDQRNKADIMVYVVLDYVKKTPSAQLSHINKLRSQ